MMRVNGGRAFFTNADTLGDYVLVDFLDHNARAPPRRLSRRGRTSRSEPSLAT